MFEDILFYYFVFIYLYKVIVGKYQHFAFAIQLNFIHRVYSHSN